MGFVDEVVDGYPCELGKMFQDSVYEGGFAGACSC